MGLAAGSPELALRIARNCCVLSEAGGEKTALIAYRNELYAKLKALQIAHGLLEAKPVGKNRDKTTNCSTLHNDDKENSGEHVTPKAKKRKQAEESRPDAENLTSDGIRAKKRKTKGNKRIIIRPV